MLFWAFAAAFPSVASSSGRRSLCARPLRPLLRGGSPLYNACGWRSLMAQFCADWSAGRLNDCGTSWEHPWLGRSSASRAWAVRRALARARWLMFCRAARLSVRPSAGRYAGWAARIRHVRRRPARHQPREDGIGPPVGVAHARALRTTPTHPVACPSAPWRMVVVDASASLALVTKCAAGSSSRRGRSVDPLKYERLTRPR